jgi:hypothetical protein
MAANMPNMPMGFGFPTPPGVPSYPGTPGMNAMPGLQNNPMFDGISAHGLTTSPYDNALFEDLNTMQSMIYNQNMPPLGYPPAGPNPLQGGGMPPMGGSIGAPIGGAPIGTQGSTGGSPTGHGAASGGQNAQSPSAPGGNLNKHA